MTSFCSPGQMIWEIMDCWVAGWVLCKLFKFLQTYSITSSNYMILALSVERHRFQPFSIFLYLFIFGSKLYRALYLHLLCSLELILYTVLQCTTANSININLLINTSSCFITPRENSIRIFEESAKILTMEAKTVKTNKRTESGQKSLKSTKLCHYFEPL